MYDRIDQEELDEILAEDKANEEDDNPTDTAEAEEKDEEEAAHDDDADDETEEEADEEPVPEPEPLRVQPQRNRRPPERLTYAQAKVKKKVEFEIPEDSDEVEEYDPQYAMLLARCMAEINAKVTTQGASYGQQYILQKGLMKFKKAGEQAAGKELEQLHKRNCFTPIDVNTLSPEEKRKTMEALMFLTE